MGATFVDGDKHIAQLCNQRSLVFMPNIHISRLWPHGLMLCKFWGQVPTYYHNKKVELDETGTKKNRH